MPRLDKAALAVRGTVTHTEAIDGRPPGRYTYQATAPGKGNLPGNGLFDRQIRRAVIPIDPQTPAQLAQRGRVANAVQAWQLLTETERQQYRKDAAKYGRTGYNLFISRWLRNH